MAKRVVTGMDEQVATWVASKVPHMSLGESPFTAIGLLDARGYLIAGTVYSVYTGNDIMMHVAVLTPRSITRRFIEEGFKYPFIQLNCARVTAMVAKDNAPSHAFVKGLGFVREGALREWYEDGQDGIIYGMLRRECRWIHPRKHYHGQPSPDAARRAGNTPAAGVQ